MRQFMPLPLLLLLLAGCDSGIGDGRAVGQLASDRVELGVESTEAISAILVTEGQSVVEGQLLMRQTSDRAAARLAESEAALRQAQARLDELVRGPRKEKIAASRDSVEGATQELEFRTREYERARQVHERGLASPEDLDRAKVALDTARSNLDVQRAQLSELLSGTTVEEIMQAEAAVDAAEARRDLAGIEIERLEIRAPIAGVVDQLLFEVGERPRASQPVLVLLPGEQPHARVYVPAALRTRVAIGSNVTVHVDGLDKPLAGAVRWVSSEAAFTPYFALTEHDRGRLSYEANVELDLERQRLPDGIPVEVEFNLADE